MTIAIARRDLFSAIGLLTAGTMLEGCGTSASGVANQFTNALTIGGKVEATLYNVFSDITTTNPGLIPSGTVSLVQAGLKTAEDDITTVLGMAVPSASASTLTQIETYLNDGVTVLGPVLTAIDPSLAAIVTAAEDILPIFEAIVPLPAVVSAVAARVKTLKPHAAAAYAAVHMPPDQALKVVDAYLASKKK